jgi:molybdopterin/thiamine biosynthesis adenylyltransferase
VHHVKDWNSSLSEAMQSMVSDQSQGIDSVVTCNQDIKSILALNKMTRLLGIKFVALRIHGNCGFLFNDFLEEFIVDDIDGEIDKEVTFRNPYIFGILSLPHSFSSL